MGRFANSRMIGALTGALCLAAFITPLAHAQIVMDGSTGVAGGLAGPAYAIPSTTGLVKGTNLFHSFDSFDLGAGDTATWSSTGVDSLGTALAASSITNLINRVTGGTISNIDGGLISTAYTNADFYFINPAGVVFGPNASVNVPQSFYVSTADEVKFAGGASMRTDGANNTFVSAAPEAFGFFDGPGGDLQITGSQLTFGDTNSVAFVAEDIVTLDAEVITTGQYLDLVAVGEEANGITLGEMSVVDPLTGLLQLTLTTTKHTGSAVNEAQGQATRLKAGEIIMGRDDWLYNNNYSTVGPFGRNHYTRIDAWASGAINGPDVLVTASRMEMTSLDENTFNAKRTAIFLQAGYNAPVGEIEGNSGNVVISVETLDMYRSRITTYAPARGDAGNVTVVARTVTMSNRSNLGSHSDSIGRSGDINLVADQVSVSSGSNISTMVFWPGQIDPVAFGTAGASGDITLTVTGNLDIVSGGWISTEATESNSGDISITADSVNISGQYIRYGTTFSGDPSVSSWTSGIETTVNEFGRSGNIDIRARQISILAGGNILSNSGDSSGYSWSEDRGATSPGDFTDAAGTGNITLTADELQISGYAAFTDPSINFPDGQTIPYYVQSFVSSSSETGGGPGGTVTLNAPKITIGEGGVVAATTQSVNDAGTIVVNSDELLITGGIPLPAAGYSPDIFSPVFGAGTSSAILANTSGDGNAGSINIDAESVVLDNQARISSSSNGDGNAGLIDIDAGTVVLDNQARISSTSELFATGDAGSIDINAASIHLDSSFIDSRTWFSGAGGTVTLTADNINILRGSAVVALSMFSGPAGDIFIYGGNLTIDLPGPGGSGVGANTAITTQTYGSGDAGSIIVEADHIRIGDSAWIFSGTESLPGNPFGATLTGDAGSITIIAASLEMDAAGFVEITDVPWQNGISTTVDVGTEGGSGEINITIDGELSLRNGSSINTYNTGYAGDPGSSSGNIAISADTLIVEGNSSPLSIWGARSSVIASTSDNPDLGAGDVTINARRIEILNGGEIAAQASGALDAGVVTLTGQELLISGISDDGYHARLIADTQGAGNAGTIKVNVSDVQVLDGGQIRSNTSGSGNGGVIVICCADTMLLSGAESKLITNSAVNSSGDAGLIIVKSSDVVIDDGAEITVATNGSGEGGSIVIKAHTLSVIDSNQANSSRAGIQTTISGAATAGTGKGAGNIIILAGEMTVQDGSFITTASSGDVPAGQISIRVGSMIVTGEGTTVTSQATGSSADGDAGSIDIGARTMEITDGASFSTESQQGAGGNISLGIDETLLIRNADVATSVYGGLKDGGNIIIGTPLEDLSPETDYCNGLCEGFDPFEFVEQNDDADGIPNVIILDGAKIEANAIEGDGGDVHITSLLILENTSNPSTITASSELGIEGRIEVNAGEPDVSGVEQDETPPYLDASQTLEQRCVLESRGFGSTLILPKVPALERRVAVETINPAFYDDETGYDARVAGSGIENTSQIAFGCLKNSQAPVAQNVEGG